MGQIDVRRRAEVRLQPDPRRVILKPFFPGAETFPDGRSRHDLICARVLAMSEDTVERTLEQVIAGFGSRHRNLATVLDRHFDLVRDRVPFVTDASPACAALIGAYFTHEFSIEAAALGNPSIVAAPDQTGVAAGECRFVMSLRAIGEGHISSIEFRTGVLSPDSIRLDHPGQFVGTGVRAIPPIDKRFFESKLEDLGALNEIAVAVLHLLDDGFSLAELEAAILRLDDLGIDRTISFETTRILHWLASSNYRITFDPSSQLAERVIFPGGPAESHGMEDVRLVRFVQDDGSVVYYGTYTAFDGFTILPQLLETSDFRSFRVFTLSGECAQNKGIALFPRKIGGQYVALGRQDNVNNFLMTSPDVHRWRETERIQEPERPWELVQLGNCGSPLETEAGWLVITHGVGPLRSYVLGALLLDREDPARVIGHLSEPLLSPAADEREGYVPNVVYSCGSMIHGRNVVVPYGFADVGASVATIELDELLSRLLDP